MAFRKGLVLTFGLVTAIVKLDSATEAEASLTTVCVGPAAGGHAPTPISQKRHCSHCGEVAYTDLKKASKTGSDQYQVVEQSEVAAVAEAAVGATKKLLTITVHDADEVQASTVQGHSVYYVSPDGAAQLGAYSLMLDSVQRHPELAFLTTYTPTSSQSMFRLAAHDDALVLAQLRWPEQVQPAPVTGAVTPDTGLKGQMDTLLSSIVTPFEPSAYKNDYRLALDALLASKESVTGEVVEKAKGSVKTVASAGVVDLSAQLAAMLAGAAAPEVSGAPVKKPRVRKTA